MHGNYAQVGVVKPLDSPYFNIINEFLVSDMTFHNPSLLDCHKGNHPTTPLSTSMCGNREGQKSTKSQIAFMRSGFFLLIFISAFAGLLMNQTQANQLTTKQLTGEQLTIATASNFIKTLEHLSKKYTAKTGRTVTIVQGSSGALATQILHGLPVDLFLSADQTRINKLIKAQKTLPKTRFTYAIGQLTLWSADKTLIPDNADANTIVKLLTDNRIKQIAIANPNLAPYGRAAAQTIQALGLQSALTGKTIYGQNIAQAFTITAKGGVQLGFIARAQAILSPYKTIGSFWHVPASMHQAIKQDGIIIKTGKNQSAAQNFISYLKSQQAISLINKAGFKTTP